MPHVPVASKPYMPTYDGYTSLGSGLLPWSWAAERLAASHNYWLATVGADGRPHVMPVWGLWLDDRYLFSTSEASRKGRNLVADARCTVTTERADEAVIVEGVAGILEAAARERFNEEYQRKYDWDMSSMEGPMYVVSPRVVFGLIERPGETTGSVTRWRFGG